MSKRVITVMIVIAALVVAYIFLQDRKTPRTINPGHNSCNSNQECVWFYEPQGNPLGRIHCTGLNYAKTCRSCEKLPESTIKNFPTSYKCFCNSNNRCQESR